MVDAAQFSPTVAPGGIAALFGVELADGLEAAADTPLPLGLEGTRLFGDGWASPLFFVSEGQINFQVPYEVGAREAPSVVMRRDGVDSVAESVAVADYAPGLFSNAFTGEPIVVRFADATLITADNPARPGDVLILYSERRGRFSEPASDRRGRLGLATVGVGGALLQTSSRG